MNVGVLFRLGFFSVTLIALGFQGITFLGLSSEWPQSMSIQKLKIKTCLVQMVSLHGLFTFHLIKRLSQMEM